MKINKIFISIAIFLWTIIILGALYIWKTELIIIGNTIMTAIIFVWIWLVSMFLYMIPTFIGCYRKHHNTLAIGMLNLLLGWTMLGWIISLIWACTNNIDNEKKKVKTKKINNNNKDIN